MGAEGFVMTTENVKRETRNVNENEEQEFMRPGHMGCPGCGVASTMRLVLKVLGEKTIVVIIPGCHAVISANYPNTVLTVPCFHSAFEIAAPTAAGIANALKIRGEEDTTVLAMAGDGGTFDIGLQSLSGAADRNENFIYLCLDNEAYMNTGIQSSSSTPEKVWTMTTPGGRRGRKKDLMDKIKKAKAMKGTRFIHTLAPCPTGWRMAEDLSGRSSMLAVETKLFPLYEIIDGTQYRITHEPQGLPVKEYTKIQGRYRHFTDGDIDALQRQVDEDWEQLTIKAKGCRR
jgi:pyruvate/2-oxoacid:ferredoxin oxidoreductase beta subunit